AVSIEESVLALAVAVEREVLAEKTHRLDRRIVELGHRGDGHPVAPQQLTHERAGTDTGESAVRLVGQHGVSSLQRAASAVPRRRGLSVANTRPGRGPKAR